VRGRSGHSVIIWPLFLVIPIAACFMLILGSWILARRAENPSTLSGLRGDTIVILRFPSQTADKQQIWIGNDESATRGNIYSGSRRKEQLTHTEWQAVNDLREAWCGSTPQFSASKKDDIYELGLLCGTRFDVMYKLIEIPEDQLPAPLATILTRVPAPQ
jgi:hypothetical protein